MYKPKLQNNDLACVELELCMFYASFDRCLWIRLKHMVRNTHKTVLFTA